MRVDGPRAARGAARAAVRAHGRAAARLARDRRRPRAAASDEPAARGRRRQRQDGDRLSRRGGGRRVGTPDRADGADRAARGAALPHAAPAGRRRAAARRAVHGVGARRATPSGSAASSRAGEIDVAVGTHALLQDTVAFRSRGLVVVDEQHRFGVRQRAALRGAGEDGAQPHTLVMTATPIPRTLAMTLHGDLDLTVLDELPPGRLPVRTLLARTGEGREVLRLLRETVARGEQAYVVYPLIEESEKSDLRAASESAQRIAAALPDARVDLVHGRLDDRRAPGRDGALRVRRDAGARVDDGGRGGRRRRERDADDRRERRALRARAAAPAARARRARAQAGHLRARRARRGRGQRGAPRGDARDAATASRSPTPICASAARASSSARASTGACPTCGSPTSCATATGSRSRARPRATTVKRDPGLRRDAALRAAVRARWGESLDLSEVG